MSELASSPENQGQDEHTEHNLFAHAHRSEVMQFLLNHLLNFAGVFHFRRVQFVQYERHNNQCYNARYDTSDSPQAPGNLETKGCGNQGSNQRVTSHGGHEHSGRNGVALVNNLNQICTNFTSCATRFGTESGCQGTGNRENNPAGTSRIGRRCRRQHKVTNNQCVR